MIVEVLMQMSVLPKELPGEMAAHGAESAGAAVVVAVAAQAVKLDDTDHRGRHDSEPLPCQA